MRIDQPWGGAWIDLSPAQLDSFYRGSCVVIQAPARVVAQPQDERNAPDVDHNAMCGEAWLAWAMTCVGLDTTEEQVVQWLRALYGEPAVHSGTTAAQLVAYAVSRGAKAYSTASAPSAVIALEEPQGHLVGVCVWCTPYAVPCTQAQSLASARGGLGHWIGPAPQLQGATVNLSESFKLLLARILFILLRGAEPTVPEYTGWANAMASDGSNLDQIGAQMLGSPEGSAHLAAVAKAIALAADPGFSHALADILAEKAALDALLTEVHADEATLNGLVTAVASLTDRVNTLDAEINHPAPNPTPQGGPQ